MQSIYRDFLIWRDAIIRRYAPLRWLFLTKNDQVVIIQWPNLPLWSAILFWIAGHASAQPAIHNAYAFSLFVWALIEAYSGVDPFRRLLGVYFLLARYA